MQEEVVKIVVFVPETHADIVRQAMGEAGAGKIGNYTHCSFSIKGTGRSLPLEGSDPFYGKVGRLNQENEERIEMICFKKDLEKISRAIRKVHPYEEISFDVYPLLFDPSETLKR